MLWTLPRNVHEITYTTCPLSLWERVRVRVRVLNAHVISCMFLSYYKKRVAQICAGTA